MTNIGNTTQTKQLTSEPLYQVGDLFIAEIDKMKDSGVCISRDWFRMHETWIYTIRWSKAEYKDFYSEAEIELCLIGGVWKRYNSGT